MAERTIVETTMYQTTAYPYTGSAYYPLYGSGYGNFGGGIYQRPQLSKAELADQRREEARLRKIQDKQEKGRQQKLAKRTLADLSDESKRIFMNIVRKTYKDYQKEQEVRKIMSGLKWFLILLGLAIFLNFNTILKIIQTAVTGK